MRSLLIAIAFVGMVPSAVAHTLSSFCLPNLPSDGEMGQHVLRQQLKSLNVTGD